MHARPAVAALVLGGLLAVSNVTVAAQTPTIPFPGYPPQPAYVADSCLFGAALNWHVPEQDVAGPDTAASTWYSRYQVPAHATITLHGDFPHGRFLSFTTYTTVNGEPGVQGASLTDQEIAPDPGSVNPFQTGVDRDGPNRAFTVTLSSDPPPAGAEQPNTLYTGQAATVDETQTVELIERLYLPDHHPADLAGGVPLPTPTLTLADGTSSESQAACDQLSVVNGMENAGREGAGVGDDVYTELRDAGPLGHPAVVLPFWSKYFNTQLMLAPLMTNTPSEPLVATLPTDAVSGFYSNAGNDEIYAYGDRRLGPDPDGHNVLVLTGTMPTHPSTVQGDPVTNDHAVDVRYFSLCGYGAIARSVDLPAATDCLYDEQIPTDADQQFAVVISLPEDRPLSANADCGVAWMDWGMEGDHLGAPTLDLFVVRHELSNPDFANSMAKITQPGMERVVLGPYYPEGTYMTSADFDLIHGCGGHGDSA